MKFYKVSYGENQAIALIAANSPYEAVGFYLMEAQSDYGEVEYVNIKRLDLHERVKVDYGHIAIYDTVEEIYHRQKIVHFPCVIANLLPQI
ncbi:MULTISPECIES: hypothetical protein [Bacillus cereus group]|uniref:hypothetical protein n=2 Tax=Bacillaceae TaxID=186817 RepID=UPI0008FE78FB|nr:MULTISPECIES: hypothetical protein [Bacillus cereus group]MDA2194788.1 hypothetical protein [Bacillus cereus group sp. Bc238]MDA2200441.1 hypothetical protein [Bacillus cereus group sp. Bc237]OJD97830.1 hypothetical protein A9487_25445 [Bacillus cereus]